MVCVFLLPKFIIDLVPDLLGLGIRQYWIYFVAEAFTPEKDTVAVLILDKALILVMRFASHSIFRAFIPLTTPWNINFVTELSLENQLVVD